MTFLTPWSALLAAAAAIPLLVLLYVLRLRRQRIRIASTLLWQKSFEDLQANVPFQRLRWSILLLLQLLALLLLLLALSQPMIHGETALSSRVVLLIDQSASMGARMGDQRSAVSDQPEAIRTRLDEAKEIARDMVDALGRVDQPRQMMVIAFGSTPQIITTYESNRTALVQAIDSIQQTDEQADLDAALQLAGAYSGGSGTDSGDAEVSDDEPAEVILLSDGGVTSAENNAGFRLTAGTFRFVQVAGQENLEVRDQRSAVSDQQSAVGDQQGLNAESRLLTASANNLGITSFSIRREMDDPARVLVFARVSNAGSSAVETTLTLLVNDQPETTLRRTIPAATAESSGEEPLALALQLTGDAILTLRHNHRDDLPSDDLASLVLPAPSPSRIALVHPDGAPADPFLHDLISAMEPGVLRVMKAEAFAALDAGAIDSGEMFDLVVLDRVSVPRLPGVATLSFGAVSAKTQADAAKPPATADLRQADVGKRILSWDRQHPLMRQVSLDTIVYSGFTGFDESTLVAMDRTGAMTLATGPDGPVIIEHQSQGVKHIVIGFELIKSNWPLHVSSAVFMQNTIEYLTPARLSATGIAYRAGEPITIRTKPDVQSLVIRAPSIPVAVESGRWHRPSDITVSTEPGATVTLPPLRHAGVYAIEGAAAPNDRLAVNVMSDSETDTRPRDSITVNAEETSARTASAAGPQPLWPWLVMAAFALLVIEWLVYCRKASG